MPAIETGTYYFLDMGNKQYGECIVCVFPSRRILIDAGHPNDLDGQVGCRSIPQQLEEIFPGKKKFHFDLMVITHCHDDHVGCMPELVRDDIVTADWALVSDEQWGFGRDTADTDTTDFGLDDADSDVSGLVTALLEEDHSDLPDSELAAFIDAAAKLEDRYTGMLDRLKQDGTRLIRFQRDKIPAAFANAFKSTGLELLGPEKAQLRACSEAIRSFAKKATRTQRKRKTTDADLSAVALYREMVDPQAGAMIDMAGTSGPPKNNTSIVMAFGKPGERVLLAGDLQLANAEMPTATVLMEKLRNRIEASGPYVFVKALHHTSYNGQDDDVLQAWGYPKFVAHSGGRNDKNHPDSGALKTLKKHSRDLEYARTDRNGIVQFTPGKGFTIEKGRTNDFTSNAASDTEEGARPKPTGGGNTAAVARASEDSAFIVRVPPGATTVIVDGVSFEFAPGRHGRAATNGRSATGSSDEGEDVDPQPSRSGKLGGGRDVSKLLFVTDSARLRANVGQLESKQALSMIAANSNLLDTAGNANPAMLIRSKLNAASYDGVVLVGGFDVLPSTRLDVLTPQMRTRLGDDTFSDPDNFIVWNDDTYGDMTGDGLPDLPVSRIPDARDAELLFRALTATPGTDRNRYGIRNAARAFADSIWNTVPGVGILNRSEPFDRGHVKSPEMIARHLYFMLHGSATDGRVFSGERIPKRPVDAVFVDALHVSQVPKNMKGVVFAGCCWGALSVKNPAGDSHNTELAPRVVESSIALSFLKAGALAFVGCTGAHYSPDDAGGYAGGPMQQQFWAHMSTPSASPAKALFDAKVDYLAAMPHGRTDLFERAIERKILGQFTCLGLGW